MITVNGLTKYYGRKLGVEDISFHIEAGDMVGLLGPNGAGKSTIMKMLAGHQMPTSGTIEIDGKDSVDYPKEVTRVIGFMPENPPLYYDMETEAFLRFSASIKGIKKKDRETEIGRVIDLTNIAQVKHRTIGNLSKGYRQRVGLAQTLIGMPKIIILDEPTAGLDPKQISEVRDLLRELQKAHTILISSHILAEITQICDKVIIMNKGHLAVADTMENLRKGETDIGGFILRTTASIEVLKQALCHIPEIKDMIAMECGNAGEGAFYICGSDSDELRKKTADILIGSGIPILELYRSKVSLEQIFLRLTDDSVKTCADTGAGEEM